MSNEPQLFHFVYETTNIVNGKKYIGKHSTTNINDGYIGSGTIIRKSIKKYGKLNFTRKILKLCNSFDEAYDYESLLITPEICNDRNYYNVMEGGRGGSKSSIIYCNNSTTTVTCNSVDEIPEGYTRGKLYSTTLNTFWVTNGTLNILLKQYDLIPENYYKGCTRNIKYKSMIWVNDGVKSYNVDKNFILPSNYKYGRIVKPTTKGSFWVTNGTINKLIKKDGLIPIGFTKGKLQPRNSLGQFKGNK